MPEARRTGEKLPVSVWRKASVAVSVTARKLPVSVEASICRGLKNWGKLPVSVIWEVFFVCFGRIFRFVYLGSILVACVFFLNVLFAQLSMFEYVVYISIGCPRTAIYCRAD